MVHPKVLWMEVCGQEVPPEGVEDLRLRGQGGQGSAQDDKRGCGEAQEVAQQHEPRQATHGQVVPYVALGHGIDL
jgi:hypothetical protein